MSAHSDSYRKVVERLLELRSPEAFPTGRPEHEAIVYETFLRHATDRVMFFVKELRQEMFGRVSLLRAFLGALRRGVKISILVQTGREPAPVLTRFERWQKEFPGQLRFVRRPPANVAAVQHNFAVMDGRACRFVPNRDEPSARACMNDLKLAHDLETEFESLLAE